MFLSLTVSIIPSCYSPFSQFCTTQRPEPQHPFCRASLWDALCLSSPLLKVQTQEEALSQQNFGIIFLKSPLCLIVRTAAHLLGGLRLNPLPKPTPGSKKPSNPSAVFSCLSLHTFPPLAPPSHCRCLHQTPNESLINNNKKHKGVTFSRNLLERC